MPLAQGPPSPSALGTPQLPDSPESSEFEEGIPLSNGSGKVHIVLDLSDTPEVVEFSPNDELMDDPLVDPKLGSTSLIMMSSGCPKQQL